MFDRFWALMAEHAVVEACYDDDSDSHMSPLAYFLTHTREVIMAAFKLAETETDKDRRDALIRMADWLGPLVPEDEDEE